MFHHCGVTRNGARIQSQELPGIGGVEWLESRQLLSVTTTPALAADSVSLSYSTPQAGQSLTIDAKINGTLLASTPRTGTLTLSEGAAQLAQVNVATATTTSSGYYVLTVPGGLSMGSQALTVAYSGDTNYAPATVNATLNILNDSLKLQYTNPALANASYNVGVGIVPEVVPSGSNAAALTAAPTGSITLSEGTTVLATIPDITRVTTNSAGYYVLTATGLPVGSQTLKAVYSGDANYSASSVSFGVTADAILPTSVSSSYSTSTYVSAAYTVNASINGTVAPTVPRTGTLSLVEGSSTLASVNVATAAPNANGSFALTVPGGLTLGANSLSVVYSGDTNYATATQILQTVNASLVPDSVGLSYSTPQAGQPLTINAKINGTVLAGTTRTGTLTLSEGATQLAQVNVATATPNSSGYYGALGPRRPALRQSDDHRQLQRRWHVCCLQHECHTEHYQRQL